ncbi:MAG: anhydro-N-acetylmuramic acid kinase [Burkholderiales bacterium]|nr:anhydro-N-acetylmuramic acid kinase [Burkholderiales bacterium]
MVSGLYVGLMSGTSLDGVDGVLADFAGPPDIPPRVLGHAHAPFDDALRATLLRLNRSGPDELHTAALAANALMRHYARVVAELVRTAGTAPGRVRALGAHGQTVRHRPLEFDGTGYTLQLMNGALLAELSGIDVVCDFRSRDVAAGGQGAPLVPALHAALFGRAGIAGAVLNLGGIANLTLLHADGRVQGFDTGPANALLDLWCRRHRGLPFDADGRLAASGRVDEALLARMLAEPYFDRAPPKSTGRDLFDADWLDRHLRGVRGALPPEDVQATLAELTARSVAAALLRCAPRTTQLLVCGGGAANADLMRRLRARLPTIGVEDTGTRGVPPQQVEALAFAWLAHAYVERRAGNVASVTGARGPRILGALYPAG